MIFFSPNLQKNPFYECKECANFETPSPLSNRFFKFQNQALPVDLRHRARLHLAGQPVVLAAVQNGICMSPLGFSMFMGLSVALIAAVIVTISFKLRPTQKA